MQSLLAIDHAFMIRVKPNGSITKKIDGVKIKQTVNLRQTGQHVRQRSLVGRG